jgi:hypothetical protein
MSAHGDRVPSPKPLSEVLREQGIDISADPDYGEQGDERPLVPSDLSFDETLAVDRGNPTLPLDEISDYTPQQTESTLAFDSGTIPWQTPDQTLRTQAIAIAASSFGAAGCFDDDLLLRRSETVRNYITNGYEQ